MMTYAKWVNEHANKHKKILEKLTHLSDEQIIEYFFYDNMIKNEPDFCLLYKDKKKCHDMENLNCYLCACPHFRFKDEGIEKFEDKTIFSVCSINSKDGKIFESENALHQDCSNCFIPHKKNFIKKVFDRDWAKIMIHSEKND
jgi:Zn-finger protein